MKLKWLGHAAFLITSEAGTRLITDPYTPEKAGYQPITDEADIVIISSDNDSFHCRADLIPGQPIVINALKLAQTDKQRNVRGIQIQAIEAMEALNHQFHDPDQNGMYRFEMDGLHIGHLGDVGNPLNAEQMEFFQGLDVLLALAGGHPTLELDDLKTLIDTIKPKIVVPMHFRTLRYKPRNTFWIESFLSFFDDKQVDFACNYEVDLTVATLPTSTRVMVLTHSQ
ncbi:MAG TPA: MBL fold metallo-hydrolase [Aggregatilineales bacterium]|nr:MBL fold metallo-hydrolase [Aggregatilineales bacterium]